MGGRWVPRLDRPLSRFFFWSLFTSLFALILTRLPGLVPVLSASAPRSLLKSGPFAGRILHSRYLKRAALGRAVGAVAVAGIMVAAAFAGMPALVHQPAATPRPASNNLPANDSTPFFPYLVPGSDYPAPMNLTIGGNLSLPQLVSTTEGGVPVLHLLVIVTNNGVATPELLTGQYSEQLAREIQEGSACSNQTHGGGHGGGSGGGRGNSSSSSCTPPSLALAWSPPQTLTAAGHPSGVIAVSAPVIGDAFSVSATLWAVALAYNGSTTLWVSNNSGANWTATGTVSGGSPQIVQGLGQLVLLTSSPTGLSLVLWTPKGVVPIPPPSGAFLAASPVLLPPANASHPATIGLVAIDNNDTVLFESSNDTGGAWTSTGIGQAAPNSTSPIFDRIGGTSLAAPGGVADQVAAVATGNDTVTLWTASVGGRVVPLTAASGNGGVSWTGPYEDGGSLGSVSDPTLALSPAGYIIGSWRDSLGAVELQLFGPDGRSLSGTQEVSPQGLLASSPLAFTVDSLERPFFAWVPANASVLQITGALLHSAQAVNAWFGAVQNLTADELVGANESFRTALEGKLTALSQMVNAQPDPTGAIEKIEQDLYPKVTSEQLVLGCTDSKPVCGHLHRGQNPSWIVNGSAPLDANVFLAVYAIWTLESLGVLALIPAPGDSTYVSTWAVKGCTISGSGPCETLSATATAQVEIAPADPTDANVSASMDFPTLVFPNVTCYKMGDYSNPYITNIEVSPSTLAYGLSVSNNIPTPVSLSPASPFLGSVQGLFRNSTPLRVYFSGGINSPAGPSPTLNVTACPGIQPVNNNDNFEVTLLQGAYPPCGGSPQSCSVEFSDEPLTFSTEQNATPVPPQLIATRCSDCSQWNLSANGSANVPSKLFSNVTAVGHSNISLDSLGYQHNYTANATLTTSGSFTFSGEIVTPPGGWCVQFPVPCSGYDLSINYGGPGGGSSLESTPFSCSFSLTISNLQVENLTVSNVTATSADVAWTTSSPTGTELSYFQVGTGNVSTAANAQFGLHHRLHLAHLEPFALYSIQIASALPPSGCVSQRVISPITSFQTSAIFPVTPSDLPYDSLTKEGGGEQLTWPIPKVVVDDASLVNGNLAYFPAGSPNNGVVVPLTSEKPLFLNSLGQTLNETWITNIFANLTPQTVYDVQIQLNFSYNESRANIQCNPCNFTAVSEPFSFDYLKDTSGDGLADSEKAWGWPMSYVGLDNQYHLQDVWALGSRYATNGITSDYVEKEFGLNPFEVDSTGSGMMDLWNLTFLVGQNDLTGFNLWYENNSDPFNDAQFPGEQPTGAPLQSGLNNVTDDSQGSAQILWSASALQTFERTVPISIVDGKRTFDLRATTGSYQGQPTITVEGKLSWGANPLAVSTYGDGVPDGARPNPLGPMGVQVQILNWHLVPYAPFPAGLAAAAFVNAVNGTGTTLYQGYTTDTFTDSNGFDSFPSPGSPSPFIVTFPVSGEGQYANLNVSLAVDNNQGCSCVNIQNMLNSPVEKVDLLAGGSHSVSVTNNAGGWFEFMNFTYSVVRVTERAHTLLWVPADNSTLSTLPAGLQRYTGEQDFDLLVVNNTQSGPITVQNVPEPYGTTAYNVTLQPGLNNILVPRGEFVSSPIGQSLLNNSGLNPATQHAPLGFTASEWLGRIQNLSAGDSSYIALYTNAANTFTCTGGSNCGTDPQNPNVEQGHTALQIQAVFTLNISSLGDFANLMGGLLQNYSGNLTGSLEDVTNELPTLGFTAPVLDTLANATLMNDGAFSQPISKIQSTSPSWLSDIATVVWNTVSGVGYAISVAWNYAVAAASYLYHAAVSLAQHLANTIQAVVNHAISALKAIASAMEAALQALEKYLVNLVTTFLSDAIQPVLNGVYAALNSELDELTSAALGVKDLATNDPIDLPTLAVLMWDWMAMIIGVTATIKVFLIIGEETIQDSPFGIGAGAVTALLLPILLAILSLPDSHLFSPNTFPQPIGNIVSGTLTLVSSVVVASAEGLFNFTATAAGYSNLKAGVFDSLIGGPDLFGFAALGAVATGVISGIMASVALTELSAFESADLTLAGVGEALIVDLLESKDLLSVGDCSSSSNQESAIAIVTAGSAGLVFDVLGVIAALQDMVHGLKQFLIDGTSLIMGILATGLDLHQLAAVADACHLS